MKCRRVEKGDEKDWKEERGAVGRDWKKRSRGSRRRKGRDGVQKEMERRVRTVEEGVGGK